MIVNRIKETINNELKILLFSFQPEMKQLHNTTNGMLDVGRNSNLVH